MGKPGPKELRQRALMQSRHSDGRFAPGNGRGAQAGNSGGPGAIAADMANLALNGPFMAANPEAFPVPRSPAMTELTDVRPLRSPDGFDRRAYQRVYCKLHRRHGALGTWPDSALAEIRTVSRGRLKP